MCMTARVIGLDARRIDARTFRIVLCRGGPIERSFGTERLRIGRSAINLDRMRNDCIIPLLDSLREDNVLQTSIGKLIDVGIIDGAVVGTIEMHQTENGKRAAELIADNTVDVAIAYLTDKEFIEIYDADNRIVDPNDASRASEDGIVFEMVHWELCALGLITRGNDVAPDMHQDRAYCSPIDPEIQGIFDRMVERMEEGRDRRAYAYAKPVLTTSIFDMAASVPDFDERKIVEAIRSRMIAAQKLIEWGDTIGNSWRDRMPPDIVFYGNPEKFEL